MDCEEIKGFIIEYIEGVLDNKDSQRIEKHLASCDACNREFNEIKSLWFKLDGVEMEDPSVNMKKNFVSMVNSYHLGMKDLAERPRHKTISTLFESWWPKRPMAQFAITILMLIAGLLTGLNMGKSNDSETEIARLKTDMDQMREVVMTSLLNQSSASDRINGLTISRRLEDADNEFLSVLLLMLNSDSNVNVRLAAVNALAGFADNEYVRRELVKSLSMQNSPLVQISLIDLLASIKETGSSTMLIRMINDPGINTHVKDRAREALKQFI